MNASLIEIKNLAKSYIEHQSEPGRRIFENETHDRQFVFQGNDTWEQISLNLKVGKGWEKSMSIFHVLSTNEWKIVVGVDNDDGTTSHVSYSMDGSMAVGQDKFSEPLVSGVEMRSLIERVGLPKIYDLPRTIDSNATANRFLQQVQRGDFSNSQIIGASGLVVK